MHWDKWFVVDPLNPFALFGTDLVFLAVRERRLHPKRRPKRSVTLLPYISRGGERALELSVGLLGLGERQKAEDFSLFF